jgi:hypothetical protein
MTIAVALSSLLWSCESEQTGYDVAIPLIGPIEFDETSCEISGDICSTDDDCFDEGGFNGSCTKTMTPVEPIRYDVSLSPSNPSFTFPALADARGWTSLLAALQNTDENPIAFTTANFSVTGGPVTLSVRPFSGNGLYLGREAGYEPETVMECTFTLEDSSTGDDYTDGIINCLTAWVQQNGAPLEFDIEVTSSAGAGAFASAAPKSGFVLKQEGNYLLKAGDDWDTKDKCEWQISTEVLDAVGEGSDFFDFLACENLQLSGNGNSSQPITIYGVATVYDPCGNSAEGSLGNSIKAKIPIEKDVEYQVTVYKTKDDIVEVENNVPVVFGEGGQQAFLELLFTAGAGECVSGDPPSDSATGYAIVDWGHCYAGNENPAPPRDGELKFDATGFCPVAEDSGAAGASGQ